MTCIVGLKTARGILLGADTEVSDGGRSLQMNGGKLFRGRNIMVGCCGGLRCSQALRYATEQDGADILDAEHMARWVRDIMEEEKLVVENNGYRHMMLRTVFLVALGDDLFQVDEDFSIVRRAGWFDAIGSGGQVALGVLDYAGRLGRSRSLGLVTDALSAAEKYAEGVRGPFDYMIQNEV